jgi:hypothetical protein
MTKQSISQALDAAHDEIEKLITEINDAGAQAFKQSDYASAQKQLESGQQLTQFREKFKEVVAEWAIIAPAAAAKREAPAPVPAAPRQAAKVQPEHATPAPQQLGVTKIQLAVGFARAAGYYWEKQVVVEAGSTIVREIQPSLDKPNQDLRESLRRSGALVDRGSDTVFELRKDLRFSSPAAAASFVSGFATNGRTGWMITETGLPLEDLFGTEIEWS